MTQLDLSSPANGCSRLVQSSVKLAAKEPPGAFVLLEGSPRWIRKRAPSYFVLDEVQRNSPVKIDVKRKVKSGTEAELARTKSELNR